jgi:hypothetical protein
MPPDAVDVGFAVDVLSAPDEARVFTKSLEK